MSGLNDRVNKTIKARKTWMAPLPGYKKPTKQQLREMLKQAVINTQSRVKK
jgi:hypothetical protein